jgi:hypothetical protein
MLSYKDFKAPTTAGAAAMASEWLKQELCRAGARVVNVETLAEGAVRVWVDGGASTRLHPADVDDLPPGP